MSVWLPKIAQCGQLWTQTLLLHLPLCVPSLSVHSPPTHCRPLLAAGLGQASELRNWTVSDPNDNSPSLTHALSICKHFADSSIPNLVEASWSFKGLKFTATRGIHLILLLSELEAQSKCAGLCVCSRAQKSINPAF